MQRQSNPAGGAVIDGDTANDNESDTDPDDIGVGTLGSPHCVAYCDRFSGGDACGATR